jgi:hypothetical protein
MIVLLIGPSGVGKTKTYQAIEGQFPDWVFRHLDGLASDYAHGMGWIAEAEVSVLNGFTKNRDQFLAIGLQAIADLAARNEGRHLVIDVGAGFQDATYSTRLPDQYPTIALIADPAVAHARWKSRPANTGSLDWFIGREFSESRRTMYDRAREKIDTTSLTIEQAADRLAPALRRILSTGPSGDGQQGL